MSCIDPGTRSPGRLVLVYVDNAFSIRHSMGWHFIAGAVITDIVNIRIEANRLAVLAGKCVTSDYTFVDWEIRTPDGNLFYTEPLSPIQVGSHGQATGALRWRSQTLDFEGHGQPGVPGGCHGRISFKMFIGGALLYGVGQKTFAISGDAQMDAFRVTGLNASTWVPADYFGQQGDILPTANVQYNAHAQKVLGT